VRWFDGSREVTAAVDAGRYRTPALAPGASHRLVAVATVAPSWPRGFVEVLTLQASPAQAPAQHDKVTYWVTIRR
jgi:hypothetical protein